MNQSRKCASKSCDKLTIKPLCLDCFKAKMYIKFRARRVRELTNCMIVDDT